jgi:hypothetical protein
MNTKLSIKKNINLADNVSPIRDKKSSIVVNSYDPNKQKLKGTSKILENYRKQKMMEYEHLVTLEGDKGNEIEIEKNESNENIFICMIK